MKVFTSNDFGVGINTAVIGMDYGRGFYLSDCGALDAPEILCSGSTSSSYNYRLEETVIMPRMFVR